MTKKLPAAQFKPLLFYTASVLIASKLMSTTASKDNAKNKRKDQLEAKPVKDKYSFVGLPSEETAEVCLNEFSVSLDRPKYFFARSNNTESAG